MSYSEVAKNLIIVEYLAAKAGLPSNWINTIAPEFMDNRPLVMVITGNGPDVINWLELRLGLKDGPLF